MINPDRPSREASPDDWHYLDFPEQVLWSDESALQNDADPTHAIRRRFVLIGFCFVLGILALWVCST